VAVSKVGKFITRWQSASGSERANYQLFVHELWTLLDLPTPDHACEDTRKRLPRIFDTLIAVGRVRVVNEGRAYLEAG